MITASRPLLVCGATTTIIKKILTVKTNLSLTTSRFKSRNTSAKNFVLTKKLMPLAGLWVPLGTRKKSRRALTRLSTKTLCARVMVLAMVRPTQRNMAKTLTPLILNQRSPTALLTTSILATQAMVPVLVLVTTQLISMQNTTAGVFMVMPLGVSLKRSI